MELMQYLEKAKEDLISLYDRLRADWNDEKEFEQDEEDRLIIYNIIELYEKAEKFDKIDIIKRNMTELESLTGKRYETIEELTYLINNRIVDMQVKEIAKKSYYDNNFEDYELICIIGENDAEYIDLTIYYAKTRSGYIITEIATEEI